MSAPENDPKHDYEERMLARIVERRRRGGGAGANPHLRVCLTCGESFGGDLVCPEDGDVLVAAGRAHPRTGELIASGRYRLGRVIGEGGMGVVFDAIEVASAEPVAIKVPKPSAERSGVLDRFRREAEIARAIDHPGVVRVRDLVLGDEEHSYLVMERLQGPTLDGLIRAARLAEVEVVTRMLLEVAEVVAAAHARGIVHRDLKPANVLLHRAGPDRHEVKVLDFGVARHPDYQTLTSTHECLGTLGYMAPELFQSERPSPASDVYALGVILFEALTGKWPFESTDPGRLVWLKSCQPAPPVTRLRPDVPAPLEDLILEMLAREPSLRPPTAAVLVERLRSFRERPSDQMARDPDRPPRAAPGRWVGTRLATNYSIREWLGLGRFGSYVYRAVHERAGTPVALRLWPTGRSVSDAEVLALCREEARAMAVRHPGIIPVLDLGTTPECVFLVTLYVESDSLRSLLDHERRLAPERVARLMRSSLEALDALHGAGLVSGGFSPEAIRIAGRGPNEMAMISPWGLPSLDEVRSLVAGLEGGSAPRELAYLAPEQRAGVAPDARSDLYSLALVYREALVGRPGPDASTRILGPDPSDDRAHCAASGDGRGRPEGAWEPFFERALASEPDGRFQSARDMVEALPADGDDSPSRAD